ncbi:MAG: hypothetical protein KIT33_08820 [Candidatus Kapabacteria bacterium]|nr:hypothetical protein [Ignavibacteriota bacterium]MCW5885058.1 hypothetical protein [Candidatus Kapabacteria bacterium]
MASNKNVNNNFCAIIFIATILISSCSTTHTNKLNGNVDIEDWMMKSGWDRTLYDSSQFDENQVAKFREIINSQGIDFQIFAMASCMECASTLPYFFKLLNISNIDKSKITLTGLDDYWESPDGKHRKFKIEELPVVFVNKKSKLISLLKKDFTDINKIIEKIDEK